MVALLLFLLALFQQARIPTLRERSAALERLSELADDSRLAEADRRAQEVESIRQERIRAIDALVDHLARMRRALTGPTADYQDIKRYLKLRERFEKLNGVRR